MNVNALAFLVCPVCQSETLEAKPFASAGEEISEGIITCSSCQNWFRIENGVLDFLPLHLRRRGKHEAFAAKYNLPVTGSNMGAADEQKTGQIDFFSLTDDYEQRVVNSPFYRALDQVNFIGWMERNRASLTSPVLDVGCGTGRQSIPLARQGIRVIGIDISEEMLLLARRKASEAGVLPRIDFIAGDAEHPPVRDLTFQAGVIYGVLHHLPAPQVAVASIAQKIVPGGLFYTLDPHKSPLRVLFDLLMRLWKLYDEEASDDPLLTTEKLSRWFSAAGFTCTIRLSTYLPPHLFHFLSFPLGTALLRTSDALFNALPGIRNVAGVIIAEGAKRPSTVQP